MRLGKKASSAWYFENWAELFFFILLVIGFLFSIRASMSAFLSYVIIFVSGLMAGRLAYERKKKHQFPYYLIISGFLIGYILGAYYGNKSVMIILFIVGIIVSYYLHNKGLLRDIRF